MTSAPALKVWHFQWICKFHQKKVSQQVVGETFLKVLLNHLRSSHINRQRRKGSRAAIAQWIRQPLPSSRPGSSPKHTIYAFFKLYICHLIWNVKRTKINKKETGFGQLFKRQQGPNFTKKCRMLNFPFRTCKSIIRIIHRYYYY